LKTFFYRKKVFKLSKNALGTAWGVAPYPTLLLKKERRKLFYRLRRALVEVRRLSPPKSVSFSEVKFRSSLFKGWRGGGAEPHGLKKENFE
jgi:hypothetical protein